jgi:transposase, IS30 family
VAVSRPQVPRQTEREFWLAVKTGVGIEAAGVSVGVSSHTARRWFAQGGGVPTLELAEPSGRYLSIAEREEIAVLRGHVSYGEIARRLGRHTSTIGREVRRNKSPSHPYRATVAQTRADVRARRPKTRKLARDPELAGYVQDKLAGPARWSPEQISRRIVLDHPDDEGMRISHEAIYQALYVQGRGGLRRELHTCLRTGRAVRRPQRRVDRRGRIKDMVSISDRPAEVADRAVPGHWEGDLIVGAKSGSAIGTLVERTTRFTMLLHLPDDHTAGTVRDAITTTIVTLPAQLRRSLTWDQGKEMSEHVQLRIDSDLEIYFCDPHSPWQRGTNENTNGLLRQYFPKSTDLSVHTLADLEEVAAGLNGRPRKTLGWKTPAEALTELLATVDRQPGVATVP